MMRYTENEVMEFVRENEVKFIRLAFCDLFGAQKNISITAEELPRAFAGGISFDASAIEGFLNVDRSDLFLFPEPDTLAVLPWRPGRGRAARLFCEIRHPDGAPFEGDGRYLLKKACARAREMGYLCQIGPECEFYLFELDEKGNPTTLPIDTAGYLDVAPADRGENIRRDICLTLEEMGIVPESFHHEQGPGQNEIDFRYSDALTAAGSGRDLQGRGADDGRSERDVRLLPAQADARLRGERLPHQHVPFEGWAQHLPKRRRTALP